MPPACSPCAGIAGSRMRRHAPATFAHSGYRRRSHRPREKAAAAAQKKHPGAMPTVPPARGWGGSGSVDRCGGHAAGPLAAGHLAARSVGRCGLEGLRCVAELLLRPVCPLISAGSGQCPGFGDCHLVGTIATLCTLSHAQCDVDRGIRDPALSPGVPSRRPPAGRSAGAIVAHM